jgi:hypothetical protein
LTNDATKNRISRSKRKEQVTKQITEQSKSGVQP